jgi:hypothetical protein
MELQELVERIQRWKERTSPQPQDGYAVDFADEEEAYVEEISSDDVEAEELMDNDFVEEVTEEELEEEEEEGEPLDEESDQETEEEEEEEKEESAV